MSDNENQLPDALPETRLSDTYTCISREKPQYVMPDAYIALIARMYLTLIFFIFPQTIRKWYLDVRTYSKVEKIDSV